jgi:hypothetical protein
MGKQCLIHYSRGCASANGIVVLAERLAVFGAPVRHFVLCDKNFGWMDFWELKSERFGSFWLEASATGGEGIHDWGRWIVPHLELFPWHLTNEEEHGNLSRGSRLELDSNRV